MDIRTKASSANMPFRRVNTHPVDTALYVTKKRTHVNTLSFVYFDSVPRQDIKLVYRRCPIGLYVKSYGATVRKPFI
jgi:hypothetical protein